MNVRIPTQMPFQQSQTPKTSKSVGCCNTSVQDQSSKDLLPPLNERNNPILTSTLPETNETQIEIREHFIKINGETALTYNSDLATSKDVNGNSVSMTLPAIFVFNNFEGTVRIYKTIEDIGNIKNGTKIKDMCYPLPIVHPENVLEIFIDN